MYDGPFCVLSIVDNRAFKRLCYEVLDHDPTHGDIRAFFRRFQAALAGRGLTLRGITTDGSELYPQPISEVFGAVEHQVCRFHILAELNKAVLRAVAQVRKHLAAQKPKLPRGRPGTPEAKRKARRRRHLERKIGDLFEHRHLFVRRHLTPGERRTLQRISRGLPQLRALRAVVEEIYRLFDRRCRTETALTKLARLRTQVRRFKGLGPIFQKLQSPNLEKALTFLDDRLLGSTSNAVERGNRRHRRIRERAAAARACRRAAGRHRPCSARPSRWARATIAPYSLRQQILLDLFDREAADVAAPELLVIVCAPAAAPGALQQPQLFGVEPECTFAPTKLARERG